MGLKDCVVSLDNQWSTYYPGQTINGKVDYTFDAPKKIRGIYVRFKGEAETYWSKTESRRNSHTNQSESHTVHYKASEEYFNITYYLLGNKSSNAIELPAGTHTHPFTCVLPPTLPSSFEGEYGHVRYTIKVTLDRPWKFDQETKMAFTVVSHMDLNGLPHLREPITMRMQKHICCCWCKSGPLVVDVSLPVAGYCSGQAMPIDISVENGSNVDVDEIVLKFVKFIKFRAYHPRSDSKECHVTISKTSVEPVEKHSSKEIQKVLEIPPLPPSSLVNCGIIDLDYSLQVEVVVSGCHMNMNDSHNITIGTIPLVGFEPPPTHGDVVRPIVYDTPVPDANNANNAAVPLLNQYPYPYPPADQKYPPMESQYPQRPPPYPYPPAEQKYPPADSQYPQQPPTNPYFQPNAPPASPPIGPSAPQVPGFPAPGAPAQAVFREGQFFANSIHDSNDSQHMANSTFAPRYPTYGFVIPK